MRINGTCFEVFGFKYVQLSFGSELRTRYHGRYPWAIEKVFKEYGDIVRIAPNELVFFTVEAQSGLSLTAK